MKWVTRERPKVDRVACPWLIRRFVDAEARFLFVPKEEVAAVAEREGAIPYDVPGVELGHHGDKCTFEVLLERDRYFHCADFRPFLDCQDRVSAAWRDPARWSAMAIRNVAGVARFSSDRTVAEYAEEIWRVEPVPVAPLLLIVALFDALALVLG